MPLVSLESILIKPDRIRKEFDPKTIHELANSILEDGLLQAPAIDKQGYLVLGERRFRAISMLAKQKLGFDYYNQSIEPGYIPVEILPTEDELVLLRAELNENIIRVDISWKEKAVAIQKLFSLREAERALAGEKTLQKGEAVSSLAKEIALRKENPVKSEEILQARSIRENLLVASWLNDPEVAAASSSKEAMKIVEKRLIEGQRKALSREFKLQNWSQDHQLIHGDAIEKIPTLPDNYFDVILTDPPYGIGVDQYLDFQGGVGHHYDDSKEVLERLLDCFLAEFGRITKPQAHVYLFCDFSWFEKIKDRFELDFSTLWEVWPRPLIWHRSDSTGVLPKPEYGPRKNYECILYAIKGKKKVKFVGNDVLSFPSDRETGEDRTAARKPVNLFVELLRRSVDSGDRVFDPCCGSGTIFAAAKEVECLATGIELNEMLFGYAANRIKGLK